MRRRLHVGSSRSLVAVLALTGVSRVLTSCAESAPAAAELVFDADAAPGAEAGAVLPADERCEAGAWCPVALPPAPVSLNGIWGSGPDDVWIVGSPGITIHWNGTEFATSKVDTRQSLSGIWGSGKDDIWTFGTSQTMWHSRGAEGTSAGWSPSSGTTGLNEGGYPTPIHAMWGASASDVWAVGPSLLGKNGVLVLPSVLHCDGWRDGEPNWQVAPTSVGDEPSVERISFNAICGSAGNGIWIVGDGGKVRRTTGWNGEHASWTSINSHTTRNLYAVWCSPDAGVWAAGEGGMMLRLTHGDDGEFSEEIVEVPTTVPLRALWGSAADDIWAVGDAGTVVHWDGRTWTLVETGSPAEDLFAIWGSSKSDIWITGRNVLLHNGGAVLPRKIQ